ncbi:cardiolipin synthase (CMP-forming)-like [Carassius carassius]|uniref:cardiolipin synthase (CMP-forming)-like n=1 Tax=Carassius carassius TaxID=217509 RepID=UPI002868F434|nr:cardiolipin synthase (CMP-forming)-like [Carassius carassius]
MFLAACRKSCARGQIHRLTVSTAANCHYSCHDKTPANSPLRNTTSQLKSRCWSSSPLELHRTVTQRSEHLFSVRCGSRASKHPCKLHLLLASLCGTNRFCTEASRKPGLEVRSSEKDEDQTASSLAANKEGHFQFKELYENPWTIPNYLCIARIVLSPVLGYLIMEQYFHISLGLFVLAGATDLLDGYIARNWPNQKSALGSALDPLADKILISILYISLTYAQLIPASLTALIISRDVALIAAVFYVRYKTVPPPVTLSKFFNPCYTTARLKPTLISKMNTGVQLFLVAASLAAPVFHYTDSVLLQSLWYITALTTALSGYSYYHYGKKTVEVLNNTK